MLKAKLIALCICPAVAIVPPTVLVTRHIDRVQTAKHAPAPHHRAPAVTATARPDCLLGVAAYGGGGGFGEAEIDQPRLAFPLHLEPLAPQIGPIASGSTPGGSFFPPSEVANPPHNPDELPLPPSPPPVTSNAPEPAVWGLMLLGFGVTGVAARRVRVYA